MKRLTKNVSILTLIVASALTFFGCSNSDNDEQQFSSSSSLISSSSLTPSSSSSSVATIIGETFTDSRDGKIYRSVEIGNQIWMAENLNYNAEGSKCYGEDGIALSTNDEGDILTATLSASEVQANCNTYGRLYDWETATKGDICPSGWHLSTSSEWREMVNYIENEKGCTSCVSKYLKSTYGWDWNGYADESGNGEDSYGFTALPGGSLDDFFVGIGEKGSWWDGSQLNDKYGFYQSISVISSIYNGTSEKTNKLGVRCVKD